MPAPSFATPGDGTRYVMCWITFIAPLGNCHTSTQTADGARAVRGKHYLRCPFICDGNANPGQILNFDSSCPNDYVHSPGQL